MKLLKQTFTDPILRSNNLRAIGIHAALSIIGFFALVVFGVVGEVATDGARWAGFAAMILPITFGIPIYIYCGKKFMKATDADLIVSVVWLTALTAIAGTLGAVRSLMLSVEHMLPFGVNVMGIENLILPVLVLNTLGLGIVVLFADFSGALMVIVEPLAYLAATFIPPGLLALGLRLKMKRNAGEKSPKTLEQDA